LVGGTNVAVGGTNVAVGGTNVAVGGTNVAVGGTNVAIVGIVGDEKSGDMLACKVGINWLIVVVVVAGDLCEKVRSILALPINNNTNMLTLRSTHVRINHMSEAHRAYGVA